MAELVARSPCAELALPVEIGGVTLSEVVPEGLFWVAGHDAEAFARATGGEMPGPNRSVVGPIGRALSLAPGETLVIGGALSPDAGVVVDQSDGWAVLRLAGPGAGQVLARLTPVDLGDSALPVDGVARTLLGHMTATLIRVEADAYDVLVFRSMAGTAVHELTRAMAGVAARAAL